MIKRLNIARDINALLEIPDFKCEKGLSHRGADKVIALVCPNCKQEFYDMWSFSEVKITTQILELINEDIKQLFNNFVCPDCGHNLSFDPGYFIDVSSFYLELMVDLDEEKSVIEKLKASIPTNYAVKSYLYTTLGPYARNRMKIYAYFDGYTSSEIFTANSKYNSYEDFLKLNKDLIDIRINDLFIYERNTLSDEFFSNYKHEKDEYGAEVTLKGSNHSHTQNDIHTLSLTDVFALLEKYRDYALVKKVDKFIELKTCEIEDTVVDVTRISKELDSTQIKEFLHHIINIETMIMACSQRLSDLYCLKAKEEKLLLSCDFSDEIKKIDDISASISELNKKKEHVQKEELCFSEEYHNYRVANRLLERPKPPIEPVKPEYAVPGIFNKKKVEAANNILKSNYEAAIASWKIDLAKYDELSAEIDQHNNSIIEAGKKYASEAEEKAKSEKIELINIEIQKLAVQLEQSKMELDNKKNMFDNMKSFFPMLPWNLEIEESEQLLLKCLEAKYKFEKSGVVFGKYCSLICYSTFLEYFESGRVSSLVGESGAYNLYESEIRQDLIIANLKDIIKSLEEIKNNQYIIYEQLKTMNNSIMKLNNTMDTAVNELKKTNRSLDSIKENTTLIEANTRISAYYSKKNSELINSLGYLVALK